MWEWGEEGVKGDWEKVLGDLEVLGGSGSGYWGLGGVVGAIRDRRQQGITGLMRILHKNPTPPLRPRLDPSPRQLSQGSRTALRILT